MPSAGKLEILSDECTKVQKYGAYYDDHFGWMDKGDDISPGNHKSEKYSRKKANNSENAEKGICQIKGIIIFLFIIIPYINDNFKLFCVFIYIH